MDAEEQKRLYRMIRRINAERRSVTEHLQSRSRQLDVTLDLLRSHLDAAGLRPKEVAVCDPIEPVNDGPCLHMEDERSLPYRQIAQDGSPRNQSEPWWPSIDDQSAPLKPHPGWQNIKLLDKAVRTVGVLLLGCSSATIDRAVATFQRQQTQRQDFTPIFIVDSDNVASLIHYGFILEMVPSASDQALYSGTRPWQDYIMDRLIGIRDKWHVAQFLEFGKTRYPIRGLAEELADAEAGEDEQEQATAGQSSQHAAE